MPTTGLLLGAESSKDIWYQTTWFYIVITALITALICCLCSIIVFRVILKNSKQDHKSPKDHKLPNSSPNSHGMKSISILDLHQDDKNSSNENMYDDNEDMYVNHMTQGAAKGYTSIPMEALSDARQIEGKRENIDSESASKHEPQIANDLLSGNVMGVDVTAM